MNISFDKYNQNEIPNFFLLNPDETSLYNLGSIYNRKFELRYNTLSTLTFTAPSVVNGEAIDYYDYIQYRRLVNVANIGNFMITGIEISNDGVTETKEVTCQSLEVIFSYKKLSLFTGTYTFNDAITTLYGGTQNLMTTLMTYVPGWTLGYIDPDLTDITRNFDITDKSLYDFMVNDVSQAYQCIFVFDSINKTVSAYSIANATTPTDIFISFDNLMKNFTVSQATEELVTSMNVLGGDGININYVNPLGTNTIYNFSYYANTTWMGQDLIDAINTWDTKVDTNQPTYANLLTSLRVENGLLITYNSQLVDLQGQVSASKVVRDARVQQGLSVTEISASIVVGEAAVSVTSGSITAEEAVVSAINAQLEAINSDLLFENNFTSAQLSDLNNFIIGNTYTNTNFIATSLMSETDIQDICQELYDQATDVLAKVSQPRLSFEIDAANFLFIKDFEVFIDQIELGCLVTVELSSASTSAALLGLDFNYDDPTDFRMILSNRLRLDNEQFQYGDLMDATVDAGVTTNYNSDKWNKASNEVETITQEEATLVGSITQSNTNNIVLFSDTTGARVKDGEALYLSSGSFACALVSSGATFTYNYNVGYYSLIGRICFFEVSISVASLGGTTTNAVTIELPVLHKSVTGLSASFRATMGTVTTGGTGLVGLLPSASKTLALYKESSAAALTPLLASNINATAGIIHITGNYFID